MTYAAVGEILHYFDDSDEKKSLIGYPEGRMQLTITDFVSTFFHIGAEDLKLWTEKDIEYFLDATISYEENMDVPNAKAHAFSAYKTLAAFLTSAAKNNYLSLSEAQIEKLWTNFAKESYLAEPIVPFDAEGAGKGLPKFQEKTIRQYLEMTDKWVDKYISSPDYINLYEMSGDTSLKLIMYYLVVNIYEVYRKTPQTWTKKAIADVMTYDFVKQGILSDRARDRDKIVPTLVKYMDYLADNDLLKREKVEKYQRFFTEIEPQMLKLMRNDDFDNPDKLTLSELVKRQLVLPDDEAKIREFGKEYMKNGALESTKERLKADAPVYDDVDDSDLDEFFSGKKDLLAEGTPEMFRALVNNPEQLRRVAEIYDTDPDQEFLTGDHTDSNHGKTWNEADAIKNHARGSQLAVKFFLLRRDYGLSDDLPAFETMQAISQIVDHFYNHFLETPEEWKTSSMITFAGLIRNHASREGIEIFTNFFRMLQEDGVISFEKSRSFINALVGRKEPMGSFSISKGKVRRKKKKKKKKRK